MKKNLLTIFAGTCLLVSPVMAEPKKPTNPYISIHGGYSYLPGPESDLSGLDLPGVSIELDSEDSFVVGGAIGANFADNFRGEIEASYRKYDDLKIEGDSDGIFKSDVSNFSVMLNGYYDVQDFSRGNITPFFMGGVGLAHLEADTKGMFTVNPGTINGVAYPGFTLMGSEEDDSIIAYQLGVGATIDIMEDSPAKLIIGYRYVGTAEADFGDLEVEDIGSHEVYFGLRFPIGN